MKIGKILLSPAMINIAGFYLKLSTALLLFFIFDSIIIENNSRSLKLIYFKFMDTFEKNLSQNLPIDKFKLGKKWFWVGIVVSIFNAIAGLIYGISLAIEKEHRKEGLIIIAWAIIWVLIIYFVIGPYLIKSGLLPKFKVVR